MRKLAVKYHSYMTLIAAVLVFGSWIITSIFQKDLESLERLVNQFETEHRITRSIIDDIRRLEKGIEMILRMTEVLDSNLDRFSLAFRMSQQADRDSSNSRMPQLQTRRTEIMTNREKLFNQQISQAIDQTLRAIESSEKNLLRPASDIYMLNQKLAGIDLPKAIKLNIEKVMLCVKEIEAENKQLKNNFETYRRDINMSPKNGEEYEGSIEYVRSNYLKEARNNHDSILKVESSVAEISAEILTYLINEKKKIENTLFWLIPVSWFIYALGTFFAILGKWGEYLSEQYLLNMK